MEYGQKRVSPLLAQILSQMQQRQQYQPQSWGALAAGLGASYLDQQSLNRVMQQEQAQRQDQTKALVQALGDYQTRSQGGPVSIPLETLEGGTQNLQQNMMADPEGARGRLMASLMSNESPMAQAGAGALFQQMIAQPESAKLGQGDILVRGGKTIAANPAKQEWKLGQTRDFKDKKETVTQEVVGFDKGGAPLWRELGRGEGGPLAVATSYGDMTPATATDTQKGLLEGAQTLDNLYTLRDQFNPQYLTLGGKVKNSVLRNIDKLDPGLLSEDQRQYLTDYKQFNTSAYGAINDYIRSVTGAQLSMYESERIMQGMANVKDNSPTEFISALDTTLDKLHWAAVRKKLALALEKPFEKISLDGVQGMVDEYGKQREAAYLKSGMSKEEAQEMAKADVIRLGR